MTPRRRASRAEALAFALFAVCSLEGAGCWMPVAGEVRSSVDVFERARLRARCVCGRRRGGSRRGRRLDRESVSGGNRSLPPQHDETEAPPCSSSPPARASPSSLHPIQRPTSTPHQPSAVMAAMPAATATATGAAGRTSSPRLASFRTPPAPCPALRDAQALLETTRTTSLMRGGGRRPSSTRVHGALPCEGR
jgi:hypothetical protein